MTEQPHNWAGNYTFSTTTVHHPTRVADVQALVARATKVKALGARHSFNAVADSTGELISLERFDHTAAIDPARRTVTVDGGVTYGQLALQLQRGGYALHTMASLPHITIGGACATATHGSGDSCGNLATAVMAMEVVTADGDLVVLRRDQHREQFPGLVVALGGLGVVTSLTLAIEPTYEMRQVVYEHLSLAQLEEHLDAVMASAESVSLFTDWRNASVNQVWLKSRIRGDTPSEPPLEVFGATPAPASRHPIEGQSAANCTEQLGIPGPWHERLPHFRMGWTPSSGDELQSEYLVPRQHALAAIRAMARLGERLAPLLQVSEVRTIAADTLWLSPCYQQACASFHFTWKKRWAEVRQLLPLIEAELAPLGARPHWGKLFALPAAHVHAQYAKLADVQSLLRAYDPRGKFRNAFLDTYLFA